MVLEGPLIDHLELSKQGFVLAVLRFKTIWGINTVHSYFIIQTTIANGFKWCINLYEKGTKCRRVKEHYHYCICGWNLKLLRIRGQRSLNRPYVVLFSLILMFFFESLGTGSISEPSFFFFWTGSSLCSLQCIVLVCNCCILAKDIYVVVQYILE